MIVLLRVVVVGVRLTGLVPPATVALLLRAVVGVLVSLPTTTVRMLLLVVVAVGLVGLVPPAAVGMFLLVLIVMSVRLACFVSPGALYLADFFRGFRRDFVDLKDMR